MSVNTAFVLGIIAAVVCTVLVLIYIMPDSKRQGLNPFFRFLHDLFNFKWLLLEKILKVIYIFSTLGCVIVGFLFLFSGVRDWYGDFHSVALPGILIAVLGPIVLRLTYEGLMMFIIVVKNVIAINGKLGDSRPAEAGSSEPPAAPEAPEYVFCGQCGTRCKRSDGVCPNCGRPLV